MIASFDNYLHWYKYGSNPIPFIISRVKYSLIFESLSNLLFSLGIHIAKKAYNIILTVSYGSYHPGKKYHLINGKKTENSFDVGRFDVIGISDHMDFYKAVDILTKIWY